MEINILAFGKIADVTASRQWKMKAVGTTDQVRQELEATYPDLRGMQYLMAIDKKIVTADTPLQDGAEVALLPPFSGG